MLARVLAFRPLIKNKRKQDSIIYNSDSMT